MGSFTLYFIYSDLWGPFPYISSEGYRYYISFEYDFTRFVWIYPLRFKSETTTVVLHFIAMVERQFNSNLKCLQTDYGGEYRCLIPHLQSCGIEVRHPCPYTHQQQGRVERKHGHIVELGLTRLAKATRDLKYCWVAFSSALYLINKLPTSALNFKSPFELLFHHKPEYSSLIRFGCACYPYQAIHTTNTNFSFVLHFVYF